MNRPRWAIAALAVALLTVATVGCGSSSDGTATVAVVDAELTDTLWTLARNPAAQVPDGTTVTGGWDPDVPGPTFVVAVETPTVCRTGTVTWTERWLLTGEGDPDVSTISDCSPSPQRGPSDGR